MFEPKLLLVHTSKTQDVAPNRVKVRVGKENWKKT